MTEDDGTDPAKDQDGGADLESKLSLPSLGSAFRRKRRKSEPGTTEDTAPEADEPDTSLESTVELGSESDESDLTGPPEEPTSAETPAPEPAGPTAPEDHREPVEPLSRVDRDDLDLLPVAASQDEEPEDEAPATEAAPSRRRKRPRGRLPRPTLPALDGRIAAAVTGLVVGLTGVLLIYLSQEGCSAVRNVGSCGALGLVLLVVIFVLMVLEGAALLRAFRIPDQTSTSFLAVGLVTVIAMLFLLSVIDRWFMVIVIPVLSALAYALSWWVTTKFMEPKSSMRETDETQAFDVD